MLSRSLPSYAFALAVIFLSATSCLAQFDAPINFDFSGTVQSLDLEITNPYSGETVQVMAEYNVNDASYVGGTDLDTINMTNLGDALFIRDGLGQQAVTDVEIFFGSQGSDLIHLADDTFVLNDTRIFGSTGNDILWANAGNDLVIGEDGADHLVGGPGHDELLGGADNDFIGGGAGQDTLDGGNGEDLLVGGPGDDVYITFVGEDIIREPDSADVNAIHLQNGLPFADLVFSVIGNDLRVTARGAGSVTIEGQFATSGAGIDQIIEANGTGQVFDLRALDFGPTNGDDLRTGTSGNDVLAGGPGADLLLGLEGDDELIYTADAVWPEPFVAWNVGSPSEQKNGARLVVAPRNRSHEIFSGGDGGETAGDTILLTDEADALFLDDRFSPVLAGNESTPRIIGVENIVAGGGDDIVDLTSRDFAYGDVRVFGEEGDDVLWTSEGNDYLEGGEGDDHLDGGAGDDQFVLGPGLDTVFTGSGADTIVYRADLDNAEDVVEDFTLGEDTVDLREALIGFDPLFSRIEDFLAFAPAGNGVDLRLFVNQDGDLGGVFSSIAVFSGLAGATTQDFINQGSLISCDPSDPFCSFAVQSSTAATVPEPHAIALAILAFGGLKLNRRR